DHSLLSDVEISFSSSKNSSDLNHASKSDDPDYDHSMYNTKYTWNNHINSCIDNYLHAQIHIDSYIYSFIFGDSRNWSESENASIRTSTNDSDLTKKIFQSKMNISEHCEYYLKMSSSDRIELLIHMGTWDPLDDDMVSLDPIASHSEEEPYKDRIDSYQTKTRLTEAVQTGAIYGGSMGAAAGEKITCLIKYATKIFLPLILVCASGGAQMQERSLSLMQMAKISSALYDYQ
uniref:CoA carboxyltransferase N-terminal domain-containing protein n=1 Tax=Kalanchoe fedtschenkoi TaxID=63787 RepID=A0A7N0TBJ6_KALFE